MWNRQVHGIEKADIYSSQLKKKEGKSSKYQALKMGWGFGGGGGGGPPWKPEGGSGDVGGRVAILHEFSLTQEGIYALGKARLRSTSSL